LVYPAPARPAGQHSTSSAQAIAALDKWVGERADRRQPRAENRPGEAQGHQLHKQIAFGNAEFDVLTQRRQRLGWVYDFDRVTVVPAV
jgi:hypothetical protein